MACNGSLAEPAPFTLPAGATVAAGAASLSASGAAMTVQQHTDKAILNWHSFDIGRDASVTFHQPSASSVALNRVNGNSPSSIFGKLAANGQVFLLNPNGILFGKTAQVDVGGIVASTMAISNADFLAGKYALSRVGSTGPVVNQGRLSATDGGYVALLAPEVRNEGIVSARLGTIAMAAGEAVTLDFAGDGLMQVKVDPAAIKTLVENRHMVTAEGGQVLLSASAALGLCDAVLLC